MTKTMISPAVENPSVLRVLFGAVFSKWFVIFGVSWEIMHRSWGFGAHVSASPDHLRRAALYVVEVSVVLLLILKIFGPGDLLEEAGVEDYAEIIIFMMLVYGALIGYFTHKILRLVGGQVPSCFGTVAVHLYWQGFSLFLLGLMAFCGFMAEDIGADGPGIVFAGLCLGLLVYFYYMMFAIWRWVGRVNGVSAWRAFGAQILMTLSFVITMGGAGVVLAAMPL